MPEDGAVNAAPSLGRRRLILHIGTDKTGSTTLQRFFFAHRQALSERGILYPQSPQPIDWKHEYLSRSLNRHRHNDNGSERMTLDDLAGVIRQAPEDVILLSAESFRMLSHQPAALDEIQRFAQRLSLETDVVVFVRPQPSLLNARYAQWTKALRQSLRFVQWLDETLQSRAPTSHYVEQLCHWDRSPHMRLCPIPFVRDVLAPNLETVFFGRVGLRERVAPLLEQFAGGHWNASPGPLTIEACRRVASLLRGARGEVTAETYNLLRRRLRWLGRQREPDSRPFMGLDDALRDRINEHFAEGNQAFARRWWSADWRDLFAADLERKLVRNEYDAAIAAREDSAAVAELVAEALAAAGLRISPAEVAAAGRPDIIRR